MPKLIAVIIFCFFTGTLFAQNGTPYQQDLDFIYQNLQKTPSFKSQVKGEAKKRYDQLYNQLRNEPVGPTIIDTLFKLGRLLKVVEDQHIDFYQFTQKTAAKRPIININIDSLAITLSKQPRDSVEGIYRLSNFVDVGIFRTSKKDSLIGVVTSTAIPYFKVGEVLVSFKQAAAGMYDGVFFNYLKSGGFVYKTKFARFAKGNFSGFGLKKGMENYINNYDTTRFALKWLSKDIQYLQIKNFYSFGADLTRSDAFSLSIKDSLHASSLILDLRDNGGGGERSSASFLAILREYAKYGKIYVVANFYAGSEGERFLLRLKKLNNTRLYGEPTMGRITYGHENTRQQVLPSRNFMIQFTDEKDEKYLQYEEVGVPPDVLLDPGSNWIEQVKNIIDAKR